MKHVTLTSLLVAAALAARPLASVAGAVEALPAADSIAGAALGTDEDRAEELYDEGREFIEAGRYERAVERFDRVIALKSSRTDASMYWKGYCLAKTNNREAALQVLGDLKKQFPSSRWLRDAQALEVEVRQASGQPVPPSAMEADDDLKLMALRGLMQSDPDQALPVIEKMLTGTNSPKVKDRALFVLSQSNSTRAREIIANVAKGNTNPDLQLKAIRYLGIMGGQESRQLLADVYRSSSDSAVKRAILRGYMTSGDRDRLLTLAKSESDPALRGEAVNQLGVLGARAELSQLYQSETAIDVKKKIINAMFVGGDAERMIELAKGERDPELRKSAINKLGLMNRAATSEALVSIYNADSSPDVRKAVVNALFVQNNAAALVTLARAEKDLGMKKDIVSRLSNMNAPEAKNYLMELLK